MALRLGALYDALRLGGIPEETAKLAAEEVAGYESRLAAIDRDLTVLKWIAGANLGVTLLVLGRLLVIP